MTSSPLDILYRDAMTGRLTRRQVIRRGTALGLSASAISLVLAACGGSSSSSSSGSSSSSSSSAASSSGTSSASGGSSGGSGTPSSSSSPAASTGSGSGGTPKQGGSIIIGTLGEASTINPVVMSESEGTWRCQMLYGQLVAIDSKTLKPGPAMAKSWDNSGLTYTFHLQDNIKFSDGSDLTSDDIVFTLEAIVNKKSASPNQSYFLSIAGANDFANGTANSISGVKAVDPKTVQITLAKPDASFLFNLRLVCPLPKKLLQGADLSSAGKNAFFQKPVGAGPFKFVSWNVGGAFVAERNPNFYGAPMPYLDKFTHQVIADSDSLVNSLLSGGIDGSIYADPGGAKQLKAVSDLNVLVPPFGEIDGWYFNFKNPYLAKREVRQAVAYAMDMEQFAKDSLYGLGAPAVGPLIPGNYAFDKALKPWPYDLDKAKSLLQQAGTPPDGIKFACNQGNVLRQDFLTYTQSQLSKIGWKITPQTIEWATLVDQTLKGSFDVVVGPASTTATFNPGDLLQEASTTGSANYQKYSNPQVDKLLEQAAQELDIDKQIPIYTQIQEILVQDEPTTFSWYRPYIHVLKKKFAGYVDQNVLVEGIFNKLETFYVTS